MDRTTWTDERLDDLASRMDAGFDRVDRDIRGLRTEMRQGFALVDARFDAMHATLVQTQTTMLRLSWAMVICLLGAIAAFALGS